MLEVSEGRERASAERLFGSWGTNSVKRWKPWEKTDFWDRAEKTREAATDKQKGELLLARERAIPEAEERMKAERIKRYETATVLEVEITQVLDYGCLATVLNDNRKKIFLELVGPNFAQGQRYEVRAEQSGVFKYTTVLGASSTVERWTPLAKP